MKQFASLHKNTVTTLKKHYLLLVLACLIAGFLGTEFSFSTTAIRARMGGDGNNVSAMEKVVSAFTAENHRPSKMPMVILDILSGEQNDAEEVVDTIIEMARAERYGANFEKYTKKTISALANITSGGKAMVMISSYIFRSGLEGDIIKILIIVLAFIFYEVIVCLVLDVYRVVYRRIALESRIYEKVFSTRFMILMKVRCWIKVGVALFVKNIFYMLWCFTIVGGFIKRYSYYMVPYILAENPTIKPIEAITISRKMMNGHKLECFLYDVSFLPLFVSDMLTLGITGIFISNPYKAAFFAEYYASLRKIAFENGVVDATELLDEYLFEKAPSELLLEAYSDLDTIRENVEKPIKGYTGIRKFFAVMFGLTLYSDEISSAYAKRQSDRLHLARVKWITKGMAYPNRLSVIEKEHREHWVDKLSFNRNYSILSIVLMFFAVAIGGWCWEVLLHLIQTGEFVNRGSMYGPWLPIYGCGCVLMLVLLNRFRSHPIIYFIMSILLCGTVEYMTSYFLEMTYGIEWWNYDGYFLNLNGRICAEGVLAFGLAGVAGVYVLCPAMDTFFNRKNKKLLCIIAGVLLVVFFADKFYSDKHPHIGKGITVQEEKDEDSSDNSIGSIGAAGMLWTNSFDSCTFSRKKQDI